MQISNGRNLSKSNAANEIDQGDVVPWPLSCIFGHYNISSLSTSKELNSKYDVSFTGKSYSNVKILYIIVQSL